MQDFQTFRNTVLNNKFKRKHISKAAVDTVNQVNLIYLLIWWQQSLITFKHKQFVLRENNHYVVYPNMIYNHYTGEITNPINTLMTFGNLSFPQAYYVANHFRVKVNQAAIQDFINRVYLAGGNSASSRSSDFDYILKLDLTHSESITTKASALARCYAYLTNTRHIDRDIVSNFIHQRYLALDMNNNLAFLTYDRDGSVIAATKKGTDPRHPFKQNSVKYEHTGFWYGSKGITEFKEIYVFEACVDLMSYLTLIRQGYVDKPSSESCYIALNGVSRQYLIKTLTDNPSIEIIHMCLDNDPVGKHATRDFLDEIHSKYEITSDIAPLEEYSVKDWNELLIKLDAVMPF